MTVRRIARSITTQAGTRAHRLLAGTATSVQRRHAVLTALADRHNQGTTTAGQYLGALTGDAEFAAAFDSPFGKHIRRAYIELHGEEPARIRLVAVGRRLHRKVGYLIGEPALSVAVASYPRTRNLLNGAF